MGFLRLGPAHGYELHQLLSQELGQIWNISLSQSYNILKRLEAQGDIQGRAESQAKLPSRRRFHLTPGGVRRFEAWIDAPTGMSVRAIRVDFLTRLYFAGRLDPARAHVLIDRQVEATRAGLERLLTARNDLQEGRSISQLSLDLRTRQLASVIEWLGECRRSLEAETAAAARHPGARTQGA
jgi:PadR family transcriptional regulator AphA